MKLEQLRQIIAIEEHKSISRAAKALYMGQPALSGYLNSFEKQIGVQIFTRTAKGVEPTEDGKEILRLAHQVINTCDQIMEYGNQNDPEKMTGTIKVMLSPLYSYMHYDILKRYSDIFPKVNLQLSVHQSPYNQDAFRRGECNIAMEFFFGEIAESYGKIKVRCEQIKKHRYMLFVGNRHPLYNKDFVTMEEIRGERFVAFSPEYWRTKNRYFKINTTPVYMSDNAGIVQAVCKSDMLAILPDTYDKMDLYYGGSKPRMIPIEGSEAFDCKGCIVYTAHRQLTLLERQTIQFLKEILAE